MAPPIPGIKTNANGVPDFEDLPLRKGDPPYSAWGLYGDTDELGTLNRLTDERVAAAAKSEIRTGQRYRRCLRPKVGDGPSVADARGKTESR